MPRVVKREAAKRDLIQHFVYLAEHSSVAVARRFNRLLIDAGLIKGF